MSDWQRKRAADKAALRRANAAFGGPAERMKAMYEPRSSILCLKCNAPATTKKGRCIECGGQEFREIWNFVAP